MGTKLLATVEYVKGVPSEQKIIVFSQFGEMLDLTQYAMQGQGVKSVKLCDVLSLSQRQSVLQAFLTDPSVRVILISLKAGGEGIYRMPRRVAVSLFPLVKKRYTSLPARRSIT